MLSSTVNNGDSDGPLSTHQQIGQQFSMQEITPHMIIAITDINKRMSSTMGLKKLSINKMK